MVKDDQTYLRSGWIWYSFCMLAYWIFCLVALDPRNRPFFLLFAIYWTDFAISSYFRAQRWKPMNARRQAAAAWGFAARVPLAQPHPLPNVAALPLPFTITLRPNWPKFMIALGCWSAHSSSQTQAPIRITDSTSSIYMIPSS